MAWGQEPACTPGVDMFASNYVVPLAGSPFSARVRITFDQRLVDGNVIHGVAFVPQARNAQGTVLNESGMRCAIDKNGKPVIEGMFTLMDLKAKTITEWSDGAAGVKMLRARSLPDGIVKAVAARPSAAPAVPLTVAPPSAEIPVRGFPGRTHRTEHLGRKSIDGIEVEGTRYVVTTAAGAAGNTLPLVTSDERWDSAELGVTMEEIREDPAKGRTEMLLERFTRTEPDAALFAVPPGTPLQSKTTP